MSTTSKPRVDVSERSAALPVAPASGERQELVPLQGAALVANSGVALNVDWVDSVLVDLRKSMAP